MSDLAIFFFGFVVTLLCLLFVGVTFAELRRLGLDAEDRGHDSGEGA